MIVVDTSALMVIVLDEPEADACTERLVGGTKLISAGTYAEALIVADRKGKREAMEELVHGLGLEVVPVTPPMARLVADAYARWGQGVHPASLNYGDCFAFALAQERGCPLLFIGNDFSKTDVASALNAPSPPAPPPPGSPR